MWLIKLVNKCPTLLKLGLLADSWAKQPQYSGPPYRQTPLTNNYKTVIRRASDADAKLGKIKYADGNGDAPELVPTPKIGGRTTDLPMVGRAGFSSTHGQIGYVPVRRGVAVSCSGTGRSRSTRDGCPSVVDGAVRLCQGAWSVSTLQTVGRTARLGRQHSSASHPTDGHQ